MAAAGGWRRTWIAAGASWLLLACTSSHPAAEANGREDGGVGGGPAFQTSDAGAVRADAEPVERFTPPPPQDAGQSGSDAEPEGEQPSHDAEVQQDAATEPDGSDSSLDATLLERELTSSRDAGIAPLPEEPADTGVMQPVEAEAGSSTGEDAATDRSDGSSSDGGRPSDGEEAVDGKVIDGGEAVDGASHRDELAEDGGGLPDPVSVTPEPPPAEPITETPAYVQVEVDIDGLAGTGLVLRTSAGEEIAPTEDGRISFAIPLATAGGDALTIVRQPSAPSQTCELQSLGETLLALHCRTNYAIGGVVVGLAGQGLALESAWGERLVIGASGAFTFGRKLPDGSSYSVTIAEDPVEPRQTCSIDGGEGTLQGADVEIVVTCVTHRYELSGSVTGLLGSGLVLELEGHVSLEVNGNGPFQFASALEDGSAYSVRVVSQPHAPDQRCEVANGSGSLDGEAVADVRVTCGAVGGLRISEVGSCYYVDSACWLELYNAGPALEELAFYQMRTPAWERAPVYDVTSSHTFALPDATLAPGGYVVIRADSMRALPDGQGVFHLADENYVPWWGSSGFVELSTAGRTTDFVRFGTNEESPLTANGWHGAAVAALPSGPAGYGHAIARGALQVDTDVKTDWFARAFATPGGPNDVHSDADVDEDGVPDSAEVHGGTFAGIDLHAMGARIGPRDLFVEVDRMNSTDPAVIPRREALDKLLDVFARHGFALHFDAGDIYSSTFDPSQYNLGGGNAVPFAKAIGFAPVSSSIADIYAYKAAHMAAARRSLFYYMIFGWSQNEDGSAGSSGVGELVGNDTIVTLGGNGLSTSTTQRTNLLINFQAATMMHELGHNLGLHHGGHEPDNEKPNYLSVMNYLYSLLGLPTVGMAEGDRYDFFNRCSVFRYADLTNAPNGDPSRFVLDYSDGTSGDLVETDVLELEGLGRIESTSVDYNCNQTVDPSYARDLNRDGTFRTLSDHDDWANLALVFRRSYSGNENGPSPLFSQLSRRREDMLTDDRQRTVDDSCPSIGLLP